MRIAVWHHLKSGGGKRALHDHVRGLVARGHHVECWSPPTADLGYLPLDRYAAEHVVPWDWVEAPYRCRVGRRLAPYRTIMSRVEGMIAHGRRCVHEMEQRGFDVLFGNTCEAFATPFLARLTDLPSVLYLQEPKRIYYEAPLTDLRTQMAWVAPPAPPARSRSPLGWKAQASALIEDLVRVHALRIHAREESLNAQAFDRVLCNSFFSRESILRIYGRDARVCYLGIDPSVFPLYQGEKQRYVIGLGSFGPNKGIELAVEAIATIEAARRPPLVWIGNSSYVPYFESIKARAERLGVAFRPLTMVGQDVLTEAMGKAAVMVYPSRLEPFGYAPLEANACGTVVVGITEGGIRETIRPGTNGTLIDGDDPEALGRALLRYLDDLGLATAEGRWARAHVVEHWDVEAATDRLERHLRETCDRSACHPSQSRPVPAALPT